MDNRGQWTVDGIQAGPDDMMTIGGRQAGGVDSIWGTVGRGRWQVGFVCYRYPGYVFHSTRWRLGIRAHRQRGDGKMVGLKRGGVEQKQIDTLRSVDNLAVPSLP